jgi:hypothetical protein
MLCGLIRLDGGSKASSRVRRAPPSGWLMPPLRRGLGDHLDGVANNMAYATGPPRCSVACSGPSPPAT